MTFSYTPETPADPALEPAGEKPGKRVAIVGPTGCGKTTLINLLMRFYDVRRRQQSPWTARTFATSPAKACGAAYGMVLQETWLKRGHHPGKHRLWAGRRPRTRRSSAAAKAAHAHSFIQRLPEGYDTVIGEDGGMLSQGQKQLLCIARVMLCLPPMLILDEATSSIDTRTEMKIQSAFAAMMKGRTSVYRGPPAFHHSGSGSDSGNAGRLTSWNRAPTKSLLAAEGFYAQLYKSQFALS